MSVRQDSLPGELAALRLPIFATGTLCQSTPSQSTNRQSAKDRKELSLRNLRHLRIVLRLAGKDRG
jgi:hypothetical protein